MRILCRFRVPNLNDMTGYNVGKGIVPRPTIMIIMSTTSAASATAAAMSGRAHDELTLGQYFKGLNPLLLTSLAPDLGNGQGG